MRIATSEGQSERQSENKIIIINLITLISIVANIIILPAGRYHVMTDYGDGMLTWSDAQARVAKGLTSFDWDLDVVIEPGTAEEVPISLAGRDDGDEWLLEWSFRVEPQRSSVGFRVEVDGEEAVPLCTLPSSAEELGCGHVMIDSRSRLVVLDFENERGWFSSDTKRVVGVCKVVKRDARGGGGSEDALAKAKSSRRLRRGRRSGSSSSNPLIPQRAVIPSPSSSSSASDSDTSSSSVSPKLHRYLFI